MSHPNDSPASWGGTAGLTLIELLIAMTLLSLLAMGLFSALRVGIRAWDGSIRHATGGDDIRLAQNMLRRSLERAYPLYAVADDGSPHVAFSGTADQLTFLAPAPAAMAQGELAQMTVALADKNAVPCLKIILREDRAGRATPGGAVEDSLLGHLHSVSFTYFGAPKATERREWRDRWEDASRLPELVRIRVTFPPGDVRKWPELIVAPRLSIDSACVYDPITKYCRGR